MNATLNVTRNALGRGWSIRKVGCAGAIGLSLVMCAGTAQAQWTSKSFNVFAGSQGRGGTQKQPVGYAVVGGAQHAVVWQTRTAVFRADDIHPAGATASRANAAWGSSQVGYATFSGADHAGIWTGTAASWADIHPAGATRSYANATTGSQQAGYAVVGGANHAGIWTGTAASWVDMNPAGAANSQAWGASGAKQAGFATFSGSRHAGVWSGSAASFVDLHPAGATNSQAWSIDGTRQAGFATIGGADHAAMWTGSAGTFVDLHPAGATASQALGILDRWQVGYATVGGVNHASVWTGSSGTWEDLSLVLPPGTWGASVAQSVWADAFNVYVFGYGYFNGTQRNEAVLWVKPLHPWTTTVLHPEGATASYALNLDDSGQVGYARIGDQEHAAMWTGTAASFVDLHPSGSTMSRANAIDGGKQYGFAQSGSSGYCAAWTGTPGSVSSVYPSSGTNHSILGAAGGSLVGSVFSNAVYRPSPASSWISLKPTGATSSSAVDCDGVSQVGSARVSGGEFAALWTGSAASYVTLGPTDALWSNAYGVFGSQQVGRYSYTGVNYAAMWTGTAASFTPLAPSDSGGESTAYDVFDGVQAGMCSFSNVPRAVLWHGTPDSCELLPFPDATFISAEARGVRTSVTATSVVGFGNKTFNGGSQAIWWRRANCDTPAVLTQPVDAAANGTGVATATLTPATVGIGTLTYQWQWKPGPSSPWVNLVDGVNTDPIGGIYTFMAANTQSTSLTVQNGGGSPSAAGLNVRCMLTSPCGSSNSNTIVISLCPSDFNGDGFLDFTDFDAFVSTFEEGSGAGDFNNDGFIDFTDFDAFVSVFEAGC